ncbi:hypothetical protein FOA52_003558 [Chlamydomonas sp. UWO 241]|nr:hypothetical protein FOA52_003558 [Chlamydomonas sp. UWO 241]
MIDEDWLALEGRSQHQKVAAPLRGRGKSWLSSGSRRRQMKQQARAKESDTDSDGGVDSDDDDAPTPKRRKQKQQCTQAVPSATPSPGAGLSQRKVKPHTSAFRGVTLHRNTGSWEAHLWDRNAQRGEGAKPGRRAGRQVYLGAFASEDAAGRAYDRASIVYYGQETKTNFAIANYSEELPLLITMAREDVIAFVRRGSNGFSRGASKYRGVTRHHSHGRWEARVGKVAGMRYAYMGTYEGEEDAARVYDYAMLALRGVGCTITNFDVVAYLAPDGSLMTVEAALPTLGPEKHHDVREALAAAVAAGSSSSPGSASSLSAAAAPAAGLALLAHGAAAPAARPPVASGGGGKRAHGAPFATAVARPPADATCTVSCAAAPPTVASMPTNVAAGDAPFFRPSFGDCGSFIVKSAGVHMVADSLHEDALLHGLAPLGVWRQAALCSAESGGSGSSSSSNSGSATPHRAVAAAASTAAAHHHTAIAMDRSGSIMSWLDDFSDPVTEFIDPDLIEAAASLASGAATLTTAASVLMNCWTPNMTARASSSHQAPHAWDDWSMVAQQHVVLLS